MALAYGIPATHIIILRNIALLNILYEKRNMGSAAQNGRKGYVLYYRYTTSSG